MIYIIYYLYHNFIVSINQIISLLTTVIEFDFLHPHYYTKLKTEWYSLVGLMISRWDSSQYFIISYYLCWILMAQHCHQVLVTHRMIQSTPSGKEGVDLAGRICMFKNVSVSANDRIPSCIFFYYRDIS